MAQHGYGAWGQAQSAAQQWPQASQQRYQQPRFQPPPPAPQVRPPQVQRAAPPAAPVAGRAALPPDSQIISVFTKGSDGGEVVIKTLVGQYAESGTNHGRKVYHKIVEKPGPDFVDVYLYFWDERDGPTFSGWWFGNKLGGTQVWSHCASSAMTPPTSGWKIPWDGPPRPTLVVINKVDYQRQEAAFKLQGMSQELAQVSEQVQKALAQAREAASNTSAPQSLTTVQQLLNPQAQRLKLMHQKLMQMKLGQTAEMQKGCDELASKAQTALHEISSEIQRLQVLQTDMKNRALEEKDMAIYSQVLPEATAKTNAAEDAAEKARITSEMIDAAAEDQDEVINAVEQTEQVTKEAQAIIGEARIFLTSKLVAVKRFESEKIRTEATAELMKYQKQVQEAQNKLNPLKAIRQAVVTRQQAAKMVSEVIEVLSPAELEVDQVESAVACLAGDGLTQEHLQACDQAYTKASRLLGHASQVVSEKEKLSPAGPMREEAQALRDRIRKTEERLAQCKLSLKEGRERVKAESFISEANDKVQAVKEAVNKAGDCEGPFLMGVEELPLSDTLKAVQACENMAISANTLTSTAQSFVKIKLVEVRRLSEGARGAVQEQLQNHLTELTVLFDKLKELRVRTADRKMRAFIREAEGSVAKAEDLAKQMAEASSAFSDDSKLMELSADELKEAADKTSATDKEATIALETARKLIRTRKVESKGTPTSKEAATELIRHQKRLDDAQAEVNRIRKLASSVEERLAAKKVVEDALRRISAVEEKLDKISELVATLSTDSATPEVVKEAETAVKEAEVSGRQMSLWMDAQVRSQQAAKEQMSKLQPRAKAAQEKLDGMKATMQRRAEAVLVADIVKEAQAKVKEVQEAMEAAAEAEKPFLQDGELATAEAASALEKLETTTNKATELVGQCRTFIALKKLNAKRMPTTAATEELNKQQQIFEPVQKKVGDIRKRLNERKHSIIIRDMTDQVAGAETKIAAIVEATKGLVGVKEAASDTDEVRAACEQAREAQSKSGAEIDSLKATLTERQKDARQLNADSKLQAEFSKLAQRMTKVGSELEKQRQLLASAGAMVESKKLLAEATEGIEKLEQSLQAAKAQAMPIISEDNIAGELFLEVVVEALKGCMRRESLTVPKLFEKMGGKDDSLTEGQFVDFLESLPELKEKKDVFVEKAQLTTAFRLMSAKEEKVSQEAFAERFAVQYVCMQSVSMTDGPSIKTAKSIRKILSQEVLHALAEPEKDESLGLLRVHVKAEKDGLEGWATISGQQGTSFLSRQTEQAASSKKVDTTLQETLQEVAKYVESLDAKLQELKGKATGPMEKARTELAAKLRPRADRIKVQVGELQRKVKLAQNNRNKAMAAERKKLQEAVVQREADQLIAPFQERFSKLEEEMTKAIAASEALVKNKAQTSDNPLEALAEARKGIEAHLQPLADLTEDLRKQLAELKPGPAAHTSQTTMLRTGFSKLRIRADTLRTKSTGRLAESHQVSRAVSSEAFVALRKELSSQLLQKKISAEELFLELGQNGSVPAKALKEYLERHATAKLKPLTLDMGLSRYDRGVSKLSFLGMLQEYHKCVKDICITDTPEVATSKTLRKVQVGEVLEIFESTEIEGLARMRCRALTDLQEGWVSPSGNKGTTFLSKTVKPYYCCQEQTSLQADFSSNSAEERKVMPGEVLEVVEGPRKEAATELSRVRVKAKSDSKAGFVDEKDASGTTLLQKLTGYVCKNPITVTEELDINAGKAIRKLDVGEFVEMIQEPVEEKKMQRVKVRTRKDDKEGWVTIKGTQGTAYIEREEKLHLCTRRLPLEVRLQPGGPTVRQLEEGELVEMVQGPKSVTKEGDNRVRGRNLQDGSQGWFTLTASNMKSWNPRYKCVSDIEVTDNLELGAGKVLRSIEKGEFLEAISTPMLEKEGVTRVRVRAEKDNVAGFVTVKSSAGHPFLETTQ